MTNPEPQHAQTEAACLLQSGTLYHDRIGLAPARGDFVFAGFKQGVFSIYFGDTPIFHFDLEGRWQHAYLRDRHCLKRLDGSVQEINRVREGPNLVLKRRTLDVDATRRLDAEIRNVAQTLRTDIDAGGLRVEPPPETKARPVDLDRLRGFLDQIIGWDDGAWNAHRTRYGQTYGPLPFTPPSCQNAVILQATWGDRDGRSFGGGEAHPHGVRDPGAFEDHVRAVSTLLGRRLDQAKGVFLGGPDVLRRPPDDLLGYLDAIPRGLPEPAKIRQIHAFLDDFSDPLPTAETLKSARVRGLSDVALGVESGDPATRELHGTTWTDEGLRTFVDRGRTAGLSISVLTLVGAGGRGRAENHVEATARLLLSLPLDRGDMVFLLDDRELAEPTSASLDPAAWSAQLDRLRQALSPLRDRGVKTLPYSMAKQWA